MGFTYSSVVDAGLPEVYAWPGREVYARPGRKAPIQAANSPE